MMWAASYVSAPRPFHLRAPKPTKSPRGGPCSLVVSANSQPPENDVVGGLGRTLLSALEPRPKPINIPSPEQQKPEPEEEEEKQISGSDVLWAMQKAAAKKNRVSSKSKKKNKKIRGLSPVGGPREEVSGDYSNVRPLCIKTEWGAELDRLEKRLQRLSQTK